MELPRGGEGRRVPVPFRRNGGGSLDGGDLWTAAHVTKLVKVAKGKRVYAEARVVIKQFAGMPLSWIPTTWIYKGGDLRYALNYGEVRFDVLQQFLEDSKSEWSHTGEPSLASP